MRYKYENQVLCGLTAAALGLLSWWGLDRALPVDQRENVAVGPVRAGDDVLIRSSVIRNRRCYTVLERYVFDAARVRFALEPQSFTSLGIVGQPDSFQQYVPVPVAARPGQGTVRFVISWQCNPVHQLWPIVTSIDVPITILPAQ